jgi:hypothetical protein
MTDIRCIQIGASTVQGDVVRLLPHKRATIRVGSAVMTGDLIPSVRNPISNDFDERPIFIRVRGLIVSGTLIAREDTQ